MVRAFGHDLRHWRYSNSSACEIPRYLRVTRVVRIVLGGIVPSAQLKASLTRLTLRLEDINAQISPEIEAWVAIAERDDVPPVLGMKDIASSHKLIVSPQVGKFYLEFL